MALIDVANNHHVKQYIHAEERVIPMKFDKSLMYVTILEP